MEPEQTQPEKPMGVFELCRELHLHGFPQKHHDEAYYYLRPDVMVRADNWDMLKTEDPTSKHYVLMSEAIYSPELQDFVDFLGADLQQITQTNASGWFAYTNSTLAEGITTRSAGTTMWLALANVILARYLEATQKFPTLDVSDSENVQDSLTRPTE